MCSSQYCGGITILHYIVNVSVGRAYVYKQVLSIVLSTNLFDILSISVLVGMFTHHDSFLV